MEKNAVLANLKGELVRDHLYRTLSYADYRHLVSEHAEAGTSTGASQSESLTQYTKLNDARMRRLDKTTKIPQQIEERFRSFEGNHTWLVLTESWCGDAAQTMPAMNKLAELTDGIELKVISRDENPELMNEFLTNGARSIPKLIVFDNETREVIGEWGPRPSTATKMAAEYKAEHGYLSPEFKKDLQVWYNKDKGQTALNDLSELLG